jgi:hypothetical protein
MTDESAILFTDGGQQMRTTLRSLLCRGLAVLATGFVLVCAEEPKRETVRYVRPVADRFETECRFTVTRLDAGWTITSTTDSSAGQMEVEARYDAEDRLTGAKAVLTKGGMAKTVSVQVKEGKATVKREGQEPQELDAPKGTLVTSAPDWTDIFLLCRRCDRQKKGKQEFPALWIHPTQPALRLTFSIESQGTDLIERDGKKTELDRYLIRIRNNSPYAAWADAQGRLIRLIPLPMKDSAPGLTLEGWEKAAAGLREIEKSQRNQ